MHRNEVNSGGNTARDESNTRDPVRLFNPPRNNGGFANYEHGNWKDFLRGEYPPSQKNGEYQPDDKYPPLACPPCETTRRRRQTKSNSAEIDIRLGTCNVQRDRTVKLIEESYMPYSVEPSWFESFRRHSCFLPSELCH